MFAAQCLKQIIPFALAVVPEHALMKLGYQYATLFSRCAFEKQLCDAKYIMKSHIHLFTLVDMAFYLRKDFYPFVNRVMGNCWTFNHKNATNNNHIIHQSGFNHGL